VSAKTVFLSTFQAWHVSDTDAHRHHPIQCAMGAILSQEFWSFFLGETVGEKKREKKLVNVIIFEQVIPVPLGWFISEESHMEDYTGETTFFICSDAKTQQGGTLKSGDKYNWGWRAHTPLKVKSSPLQTLQGEEKTAQEKANETLLAKSTN